MSVDNHGLVQYNLIICEEFLKSLEGVLEGAAELYEKEAEDLEECGFKLSEEGLQKVSEARKRSMEAALLLACLRPCATKIEG